jgi:GxxExxY protein
MSLPFGPLTGRILEAAFEVSSELGHGFLESIYQKAMEIALKDKGLIFESQVPLKVRFRKQVVGQFVADLLVEATVILELKAAKAILPEHLAQTINYLKATGRPVALILNFGPSKLEYRRLDNHLHGDGAGQEK